MGTKDNNIVQFPSPGSAKPADCRLIPERLIEARLVARLTQTELASRIGISRQAISYYEKGTKKPDWAIFVKIASELEQPGAFFTKERYNTFGRQGINFYRKKNADTKRRLQACNVYALWLARSAYAFNDIVNFPLVNFPSFEPHDMDSECYSEEEIESHAEAVRKYFGLGLGPISNVIRLLESKGALIAHVEIPGEDVEAFSFWSGDRPFIFLASDKKSAVRRRFDVAHELAHLCLHRWITEEELDNPDRLKQIEQEANHFAGAFLLPRKSFLNEVYSTRVDSFINLKGRWKVSIAAMVHRCKQLGIFNEDQCLGMNKAISSKGWRTNEPLDSDEEAIRFEEPLLLRRIAEIVFKSGRYKIDDLKADLALSPSVLEQFFGLPLNSPDSGDNEAFL